MSTTSASLLNAIPSVTNDDGELIQRGRVSSPGEVVSDYRSLFNDDWQASKDRSRMQSMVDGNPPWSDARDRALGLFGRTNVNWGLLTQSQQEAEQPFNDILDSLDDFGVIPIKYGVVTDQEAALLEPIIAEELHRTITQWDDFYFNWWLNAHYFTMWGVSFTFRDDSLDWRWRVESLQGLKIPRGTKASINKFDRICCKTEMLPSALYGKVRDREAGEKAGWNYNAIVAACKRSHPTPIITDDPQQLEAMWKDNSINSGNTNLVVELVHEWVREIDGSVSHYIAEYNSGTQDNIQAEFIYKKEGEYGSMARLVNAYLYAVGTNGDLHSIRGNAYSLFASAQAFNKLMCKTIDKSIDESNTYIQAEDEDAITDLAIFPRGPYMQVTNGVQFVDRATAPVAQNLVLALQSVREIYAIRSSGMSPRAASGVGDKGQKTKYELQRKDEMDGKLSSAVMNLFFRSWGNDYRETAMRLTNPDLQPGHPGGAEAFEFRRRCVARGVSEEILLYHLDFDNIQLNMGIGKGSSSERRAVLSQLGDLRPLLDQEGQRILIRDQIASLTNQRYARRLVPLEAGSRPPIDLQVANMENQIMRLGGEATVEPNQDHVTHVASHLAYLSDLNALLANAEAELQEVIPKMQVAQEHTVAHMEFVSVENENYPAFKEALQQLNEVIVNGAKHIESEQRKIAKAEAEGQPAPETAGTPSGVFAQSVDARARLESMQQELQITREGARQKMALKELETASKLKSQAAVTAQKLRLQREEHDAKLRRMSSDKPAKSKS